jgi:hypothetical protein
MHTFPHSMTLLRAMVDDLPPLIPETVSRSGREQYDRLLRVPPADAREVEDVTIAFGRLVWPYRKAFDAMVLTALAAFNARDLARKLPEAIRDRYRTYAASGTTLADLHDVRDVSAHFSREEQGMLCDAIVGARRLAEKRVRKAIMEDDAAYRVLVAQFLEIQHEIEHHLGSLRRLTSRVAEDTEATRSIHEAVREFERGFARLAREPEAHEVCAAVEAHRERSEARGRPRAVAHEPMFL